MSEKLMVIIIINTLFSSTVQGLVAMFTVVFLLMKKKPCCILLVGQDIFSNIKNRYCITLSNFFFLFKSQIFWLFVTNMSCFVMCIHQVKICFMKYFGQIQFYIIEFGNMYYIYCYFQLFIKFCL